MGLTRPRAHQLQDIDYKQTARAVTVSNVTLSGGAPATVDGTSLALRDRVLVTAQSTGSENGIYYVTTVGAGSNGTWARSLDADATGEIKAGTIIMITEGTTYADTQWKLTTDDPITVGSTTMTFVRAGNAAYGTIAVAGQNSIVADQIGDTLTMVAGTNLALTTNDGTDTLTVTPSLTPALTTATFTNTTTDDSILVTTTEDSSSAAPVITLKRNSASVADADYLGQLKFKGENDADQEVVYAKITAKIQDASDTTEDGLIEFANRKAGSNTITARLRSDSLQLLNGTSLTVAGDATVTGALIADGLSYPTSDGTADQVLVTDGAGTLSFADASGGGATVSSDTSTNTNFLLYFASTTTGALTAVKQDSGLTYNPSTGLLTSAAFSGSGASLTALNGSNISTGTVAAARVATLNQNTTGTAGGLSSAVTVQLSGDVTGSATFTSAGDTASITTTIAANSVALGTDTTGNYVGTITGGTGISSSGATTGEGVAHTLSIDSTVATLTGSQTLTNKTLTSPVISTISNTGTLTLPTSTGTIALTSDIPTNNNQLTNGAGYTTNVGDITNVAVSGTGLSGGGASGSVTITSNATNANTGSTIVARDASGNFSAGTITASLTGTASNAALLDSIDSSQFLRSDAEDTKTAGALNFSDNVSARFGTGNDLQIYHDSSNSYIAEQGTGSLFLRGTNLNLQDTEGNNYAVMTDNGTGGTVTLYHNASAKLTTSATGVTITGVMSGTATSARYADLAEKYTSDKDYEPGTVVELGGEYEVTQTHRSRSTAIAGIVSTNPAHLMNDQLVSEHVVDVALIGRVPCKVVGQVRKGDLLISSDKPGHAQAYKDIHNPPTGSVIGKAIESKDNEDPAIIEVLVGRL